MTGQRHFVVKVIDRNGDLVRTSDSTEFLTPKGMLGMLRLPGVTAVEVHQENGESFEWSFPKGATW